MSLITRTNEIYTLLAALSSSDRMTLTVYRKLDPLAEMEDGVEGIFVVPIVNDYNLDTSNKRGNVKQLTSSPRIAVVVARPFAARDSSGLDVSSWEEVENVLNLRERLDLTVIRGVTDLMSVEADAPTETMFDKRWFMSITEFYFDAISC